MKSPSAVKRLLSETINYIAEHPKEFPLAPGAFTRERKWTIRKLFKTLLSLDCHDLHNSIYATLSSVEKDEGFTTSGFVQQRDKLPIQMFEYLFRRVLEKLRSYAEKRTFHGYHVLACDGSDFPLPTECVPADPDASVHRLVQHKLLHQNALYDVIAQLYVAVTMEPKLECNERDSLLRLAESLSEQDTIYKPNKTIITCDRGYESCDVFMKLREMGYKFVIRLKDPKGCGTMYKMDMQLPEDGSLVDKDLPIYCRKNQQGTYEKIRIPSHDTTGVTFRVVGFKTNSGNAEYLLTNLSRAEFRSKDIAAIYRKRWDIEVSFRHQKYAIGGIVFHSKKLDAQRMELYTALTLYNCISAIVQLTNIPSEKRNAGYRINFAIAVPKCIRYLFQKARGGWENLERLLIQNTVRQVDNRSYERQLRPKSARAFNARIR